MFVLKKRIEGEYKILYKKEIILSKFIPKGLYDVILNIPDDMYVMGVCYDTDNQICMSGKMKKFESPIVSIKREMQEEMNLSSTKLNFCKKVYNNYFFKVNIKDCNIDYYQQVNDNNDINKRVVCCIYGKFSDVIDYIKKINIKQDNCDNITGVWAIEKNDLLKIIKDKD